MGRTDFNPEWYGAQAKVLTSNEDQMVVDYGCNGRGIVKSYKLFDGIQLCFLDFETDESSTEDLQWQSNGLLGIVPCWSFNR